MTPDSQLRFELNQLDIEALRQKQLANGRAGLEKEFKQFWAAQNAHAKFILRSPEHGGRVKELASFLETITASVAAFAIEDIPTYYPYTDVHVLDWFIGRSHEKFSTSKSRAITGILYLIKDLVDYEAESASGFRSSSKENFDKATVPARLAVLGEMKDSCEYLGVRLMREKWAREEDIQHFKHLDGYVQETHRISGLCNFSCFPQTAYHDEVLFLRVIHISELCFFGVRFSIMQAIEDLRYKVIDSAVEALTDASGFAIILQKAFKVLRTMPPERFKDFRDATGKASAIQSRNYQLMEAYFRGMNADKKEHFSKIGHLKFMSHFQHRSFLHLGTALERFAAPARAIEAARDLDRKLLAWRGAHLGFAKLYLADMPHGTGDTSGAPYLQKVLNTGLFKDTELDMETMEDLLPGISQLLGGVRVPPHGSIAPRPSPLEEGDKAISI